MSRAMVTRYLAQMESWAGARLLHRTTRKLGLTAPGQVTLLRCQQLVELADAVPLAADTQVDEPRGMLRIACSQSLALAVLAPAVTAYLQRYPGTSADLLIGNEAVDLVSERIDLAIRITNQLDPNVIARPLGQCASVVCAAPAYLAVHGTPSRPQELPDLFVLRQEPLGIYPPADAAQCAGRRQPECQRFSGAAGGRSGGRRYQPATGAFGSAADCERQADRPDAGVPATGTGDTRDLHFAAPPVGNAAHFSGFSD